MKTRDPRQSSSWDHHSLIMSYVNLSSEKSRCLCTCCGCNRSLLCGLNGKDRCDVCTFHMKTSKYQSQRRCLVSVCTNLSLEDKKEYIRQYDRLLSDHMMDSLLSEGAEVFCSWHVNGVRTHSVSELSIPRLMMF